MFDIRLIAIVSMLIDHFGLFFFPQQLIFRLLGRLAFPLFAWGIASGAVHTKNLNLYTLRLAVLAAVSQIFWMLASSVSPNPFPGLNVVFTLLFGLLSIRVYRSQRPVLVRTMLIFILLYLANFLDSDYQAPGVLSVLFSYIFYYRFAWLMVSQIILYSHIYIYALILNLIGIKVSLNHYLSLFAPLSFILTRFPQVRSSRKTYLSYLFYLVYPLQFLVFYLLKRYII